MDKQEMERRIHSLQEEANKIANNPMIPIKTKEIMIKKLQEDFMRTGGKNIPTNFGSTA